MNTPDTADTATIQQTIQQLAAHLDYLRDLFERRIFDDRDKRELIDELRIGPYRQYLHPFVRGLALVIDHLDRYEGDDVRFVTSVRDELLEVLADHGVTEVATGGAFDPARHEAVEARPVPGRAVGVVGVVAEVRRRGFAHRDWVFRPAQVVVAEARGAARDQESTGDQETAR